MHNQHEFSSMIRRLPIFSYFVMEKYNSLLDHASAYRSVYDNDAEKQFLSRLDERIKTHDREIERMCNYHYQGFVESVNELIKVRSDARTLKASRFTFFCKINIY